MSGTIRYAQNPHVTYVPVSQDEVLAKGSHLEGFSLVISDDTGRGMAASVLRRLATAATVDEVHQSVADTTGVNLEEIDAFLRDLHRSGLVVRAGTAAADDWIAFARYGQVNVSEGVLPLTLVGGDVAERTAGQLSALGLDVEVASQDKLSDLTPFQVVEEEPSQEQPGPTDEEVSERGRRSIVVLTGRRVPVGETGTPRRGLVVVAEDGRVADLYELNERLVRAGSSGLFVQVSGVEVAIGPYVVPGATACFWEYEHQRARSGVTHSEYTALLRSGVTSPPAPEVTRQVVPGLLLPHAVELALRGTSSLAGAVQRARVTAGETSRHQIMRLPRCPVCLPVRPLLRNALY